jgi:hypothetical protein
VSIERPEAALLTVDMKRVIEQQRLGFVATTGPDGAPSLAPKDSFVVLDDQTIAFGDIRSHDAVRNLLADDRIEVNFIDPFLHKGYRLAGIATVVRRGHRDFLALCGRMQSPHAPRIHAIVKILVTRARLLASPAYDSGQREPALRRILTSRHRELQPNARFDE